jgi:hypothetical protein
MKLAEVNPKPTVATRLDPAQTPKWQSAHESPPLTARGDRKLGPGGVVCSDPTVPIAHPHPWAPGPGQPHRGHSLPRTPSPSRQRGQHQDPSDLCAWAAPACWWSSPGTPPRPVPHFPGSQTYFEGEFLLGPLVEDLQNFPVDAQSQDLAGDLVVVDDGVLLDLQARLDVELGELLRGLRRRLGRRMRLGRGGGLRRQRRRRVGGGGAGGGGGGGCGGGGWGNGTGGVWPWELDSMVPGDAGAQAGGPAAAPSSNSGQGPRHPPPGSEV